MDGDALLVLFAGEQPSLDNGKALSTHNTPRNIGFVKVPQDLDDDRVLSKGPTEKGGFYDFGGGWSPQENKGVNWLTKYTSIEENASRIKVTKLSNGQILVVFEIWKGKEFVSSNVMTLDQDGKITRAARTAKLPFRMPYSDEILSTGSNTAVFYAGAKGKLVRYEVSLVSGPGSGEAVTKAPISIAPASTKAPVVSAPDKDLGIARHVAFIYSPMIVVAQR